VKTTSTTRRPYRAIRRLLGDASAMKRAVDEAVKQGGRTPLAQLVLDVASTAYNDGAYGAAYIYATSYLNRFRRQRDRETAELMSVAGNAAAATGRADIAERYQQRLQRVASSQGWGDLERRALQSLGVIRANQGRKEEAEDLYRRALDVALRAGDELGVAQAYNNLGACASDRGKPAEARRLLRKSIAIKRRIGNIGDMAGSLAALGGELARARMFREAERAIDESLVIARRFKRADILAIGYCNLGAMLTERGKLRDAVPVFRKGVRYARMSRDKVNEKLARQGLAVALSRAERWKAAAAEFVTVASLSEQMKLPRDAAMAHHDRGSMLLAMGNAAKAEEEYQEALTRFTEIGENAWIVRTLFGLVGAVDDRSRLRKIISDLVRMSSLPEVDLAEARQVTEVAIRYGDEQTVKRCLASERRKARLDVREWAWRLASLGALASNERNWKLGEALLADAAQHMRQVGDSEASAEFRNDAGIASLEQGKFGTALRRFRDTLQTGRRNKNRVLIARSAHNLGEAYRRQGHFRKARPYFQESLKASKSLMNAIGTAESLHSLGLAELHMDALRAASSHFYEVNRIAVANRNKHLQAQAAMGMAAVAFEQEDFARALAKYVRARRCFEQDDDAASEAHAAHNAALTLGRMGRDQDALAAYLQAAELAGGVRDFSQQAVSFQGVASIFQANHESKLAGKAMASAIISAAVASDGGQALHVVLSGLGELLVAADAIGKANLLDSLSQQGRDLPKNLADTVSRYVADVVRATKDTSTSRSEGSLQ